MSLSRTQYGVKTYEKIYFVAPLTRRTIISSFTHEYQRRLYRHLLYSFVIYSKSQVRLLILPHCQSLLMVPNCQNVFNGTVNYNVLDIDGTVKFPNLHLYDSEAYPTDSERNIRTLEAEQVSVYTVTVQWLNRKYRRDSIAERTYLLLSY